jgi:hypothetical protein
MQTSQRIIDTETSSYPRLFSYTKVGERTLGVEAELC